MPTERSYVSTSAVNGKIYAIGGAKAGQRFSTVEEYNPATNTWTKKADMPTARSGLSTSVVNEKIYAIGGWMLSTVEEYDPKTDKWTKKTDMPTAREWLSTSVVNGEIYAIGGIVGGGGARGVPLLGTPTVEEYTPEGWPFAVSPQDKLTTMWGRIKTER